MNSAYDDSLNLFTYTVDFLEVCYQKPDVGTDESITFDASSFVTNFHFTHPVKSSVLT